MFLEKPLDDEDYEPAAAENPAAADNPTDLAAAGHPEPEPITPMGTDHQPRSFYDFEWREFSPVPIHPESRRERFSQTNVGPTAPSTDPYEIFMFIWDRQFMEHIVSDNVASHMIDTGLLLPQSRISSWIDTDVDELYCFFGMILAMGSLVKGSMPEYWATTSDVFVTPGFTVHMSRIRFFMLARCLHFNRNEDMSTLNLGHSEAKLFKIEPVLSHLNKRFQELYILDQNISLDESLLMWKGWLDINQLVPNKSATVGIKTYEVCESQTGYLC